MLSESFLDESLGGLSKRSPKEICSGKKIAIQTMLV